jgi:hypothetical protein
MPKQIVHQGTEIKVHFGVLDNGNVHAPVAILENGQQENQSPVPFHLARLDDEAFEDLKRAIYSVRDQFAAAFCREAPAEEPTPDETPDETEAAAEEPITAAVQEPDIDIAPAILKKQRRGK